MSGIIVLLTATSLMGQMIVKVKPQRPNVVVVKPNKVSKNKVWIDGHWKWNNRTHKYQWIKGCWVKSPKNQAWVSGKWLKVHAGWKYVPGRWSKKVVSGHNTMSLYK